MKELMVKEVILWDFDGVILDSMDIRELGFRKVLSAFPQEEVDRLMEFHRENGGLSRYVKFQYFLEEIRKQERDEKQIKEWAEAYSVIMKNSLISEERLIQEVIHFIKENYVNYRMHIVSGSDGTELRHITEELDIAHYFHSIAGSPTPKHELIRCIIETYSYTKEEICLIGDSINDLEAAMENKIDFFGYNNEKLRGRGAGYITSFQ